MLDWLASSGEHFDHCIVGEPTNAQTLGDTIKIGRRGSLNGRLTVRGKQGHVAYPQRADNPAPHVLALCAALIATPLDSGTDWFDASNLEITSIDIGNEATNVIPGEARLRFNVRFNDVWTPETLAAEIRRRLETARPPESFELAFDPCNAVSFVTKPGPFTELVADAIEAETGRRPELSTTGGTSDARFIAKHGPVLEFGLVGKTMHQIDERVPVADIDGLAEIYRKISILISAKRHTASSARVLPPRILRHGADRDQFPANSRKARQKSLAVSSAARPSRLGFRR